MNHRVSVVFPETNVKKHKSIKDTMGYDLIEELKSLQGEDILSEDNFYLRSGILHYFHLKPLKNKPDSTYLDLDTGSVGNIIDWFEGGKYASEEFVIKTFTALNTYICSCDSDFDEETKMVVMHFKVVYAEYYRILESKYGAQIRERIGKIVGDNNL